MTRLVDRACFVVEPWCLRERELDLEVLGHTETVFALSNGHIGLRGTLEEGEPREMPGTYLNGFYEQRPLPYAEAGYGYPESGETVVNVTDGKIIRLLVDDEPFDLRYGTIEAHERCLDFRTGLLHRGTSWRSPTGRRIRVTTTRLVSFALRAVAAIEYVVESLDGEPLDVVVQSELLANEHIPSRSDDPRTAAALERPLEPEIAACRDLRAVLGHRARQSGLRLAAAMDHVVEDIDSMRASTDADDDLARTTLAAEVPADGRLRFVKFLAYGWSSRRSEAALRDQVEAALASARRLGWDGLKARQRAYLDDVWRRGDVEIDGDPELQQAVRFALFHTLQAGARGEERAVPAKGLTGPGYDGHTFWDQEAFVLPVLTYTVPEAARDVLRWRHSTLEAARRRSRELGLRGASFAWRTITGRECSAYWPAGTAAFHNGAAVADATVRYLAATGDDEFDREYGVELLVEVARLFASLGHHDREGGYHIDGVTGPDEYSAVVKDNAYTNLMAQRALRAAVDAVRRRPEVAEGLGVGDDEREAWAKAADAMTVHYDDRLGIPQQCEGFTRLDEWDWERDERFPLMLHHPYFELYRKQVIKQADLVLALHLRGDAFGLDDKIRAFAYYEARTVRDSSLSAATQCVVAAECGHLDLAYRYLAEAALVDLHDLNDNVRDGLHIASLAGAWLGVVAGFGGMRDHDGRCTFAPRLPEAITRMTFRMYIRGAHLHVEVTSGEATYTLRDGEGGDARLDLSHHGEPFGLGVGEPVTLPIPAPPDPPPVHQPPDRAPVTRSMDRGARAAGPG